MVTELRDVRGLRDRNIQDLWTLIEYARVSCQHQRQYKGCKSANLDDVLVTRVLISNPGPTFEKKKPLPDSTLKKIN